MTAPGRARRSSGLRIAIDGSNLRSGGAITHLRYLVEHLDRAPDALARVTLWAPRTTLSAIPANPRLESYAVPGPADSSLQIAAWRSTGLRRRLARGSFDAVFFPGGSSFPTSVPQTVMFRNSLPFCPREIRRYESPVQRWKLHALRRVLGASFQRADRVIFLGDYPRDLVGAWIPGLHAKSTIIPHGVPEAFFDVSPPARPGERPHWLYVSPIEPYKHHVAVVRAARLLQRRGQAVRLTFAGAAVCPHTARRLAREIEDARREGVLIEQPGAIGHDDLPALYESATAILFASSCENLPNALLEGMATGRPIAASRRRPMTDLLGDHAAYFDPEDPETIAASMARVLTHPPPEPDALRERARGFRWARCAEATFRCLVESADPSLAPLSSAA